MSAPPETGHLTEFGEFVFDRRSLELRSGSHVVHLQQQPAQVLAVLTERAGRIVTREELRRAVWKTDTPVDFDRGLHYAINQIRAALGDAADAPRFLETLHGRGYRFTADVQQVIEVPRASAVRPALTLAVVAVLALVATVAWWAMMPARIGPNALGVGVFSAAAGNREWADALRTDLVALLTREARLPVIDLARHEGARVPWRIEARVEAPDAAPGSRRRVTVMLRDGHTGTVRWSDVFDPEPGDPASERARLSAIIAAAVRAAIEGPSVQPAAGGRPGETRRIPSGA